MKLFLPHDKSHFIKRINKCKKKKGANIISLLMAFVSRPYYLIIIGMMNFIIQLTVLNISNVDIHGSIAPLPIIKFKIYIYIYIYLYNFKKRYQNDLGEVGNEN